MQTWNGTPAEISEQPSFPADNGRSTEQTVREMSRMARRAARSRIVQRYAGRCLAGGLGPFDRRGVCAQVYRAVRALPFVHDERQLSEAFGLRGPELDRELLVAPEVLLAQPNPQGDCDCKAMLGAAALLALGIPCCFTVYDGSGHKWEHVYAKAQLEDGSLLPLDFSHGAGPGWQAPRPVRSGDSPMMRPPVSDAQLKQHVAEHEAMRRRSRGERMIVRNSRPLGALGFESTGNGGGGFWKGLLSMGAQTGLRIAEGRFGSASVPTFEMLQLPDGRQQIIQRGGGAGGALLSDPTGVGGISPVWLALGAGVVLLVMLKK